MPAPGVVIAAPASGSGKTLLTLGLLAHLRATGVAVASAKVGPDYIDPAFHAAATGRPCLNLDSWALRPGTLAGLAGELGAAAEVVVCEGVMGLFDGADAPPGSATGATAEVAQLTGWPVVLVVDARGMAASAAAVVAGFANHRPGPGVTAVIFNRVAGERHRRMIAAACAGACPGVEILGFLPPLPELAVPSRHLGLVQAAEHPDLDGFLAAAAAAVKAHVAIDRLLALARPAGLTAAPAVPLAPLGGRMAVARDAAFAFAYPALLEGWRRAGAELSFFSPLADQAPDGDCVYLPGGYPELHAGRLAGNTRFLDGLRAAAAAGKPVFGECGGYMVLGEGLVDGDGTRHRMAGLLALETSFAVRRLQLGYRTARLAGSGPLGAAGSGFRGHEFHYATVTAEAGEPLFRIADAGGADLGSAGLRAGSVAGSFVHLMDRL
ncbi:cobyrinate a,c-diamide synthase [Magnetospirillum sp. UT-4]|uniref:cobyrinate a,c-diamide synthase n=1 Tax=Magnetospirillum sp. UT-4 TaxID=2681467 RepID=UPI0013859937|nr:cobyrinate a,c-diamide synthase [Magnetospirillum sp. UT-4]CAA7617239.1 Cobyrinic acid A,C-diamide synthase [Magnetospirillum sp. UT-4]